MNPTNCHSKGFFRWGRFRTHTQSLSHTHTLTHTYLHTLSHFHIPKVHRSKGSTLFIVRVQPSKNKLDHLRKKMYLFTFTICFYQTQSSSKQFICLYLEKHDSALLPYNILYTFQNQIFFCLCLCFYTLQFLQKYAKVRTFKSTHVGNGEN